MSPKLKAFVINCLRRAHSRWLPRTIALRTALTTEPYTEQIPGDRSRIAYKCAHCNGVFRSKHINVDHITPVVDPKEGFTTFDSYIESLFVEVRGYQVLCLSCHKTKSASENEVRYETRRNK